MNDTLVADRSPWAVFLIFLQLGLTSFGGSIAHLGYFRDGFLTRRRWLTEHSYAELVALCQFLPGPASSQVMERIKGWRNWPNSPTKRGQAKA